MYCRNCGKEIPNDSKVCPFCKKKITGKAMNISNKEFAPEDVPIDMKDIKRQRRYVRKAKVAFICGILSISFACIALIVAILMSSTLAKGLSLEVDVKIVYLIIGLFFPLHAVLNFFSGVKSPRHKGKAIAGLVIAIIIALLIIFSSLGLEYIISGALYLLNL